ncbi:MAG TPA: YqhA family protein [Gammaproteobacteria bacterium]|nr:YqhA family protein [Gammaproteobacteria bacterium]
MNKLEALFETLLWDSRFVVLSAVVASLVAALSMFYMATIDAYYMVVHLVDYASPALDIAGRKALHDETIAHVVEIVDGYLLATVLLIFAFGLYELFISKIDKAAASLSSSNVLLINSLDDLKARLAKVILMILIVSFFEHAINMRFASPLDLLYLAGGIALIGLAIYLSHTGEQKLHDESGPQPPAAGNH